MTGDTHNATQVLERILSAYGFSMQKELAEKLGIAGNNISSWVQRDSVPGNVLVKCAMDTGADVRWLVTGELAKASPAQVSRPLKGKPLYDKILASGGKAVLRRILDAYGFDTQKELGDLLNISSGTISTWVRRNYFPGDVVVACALDTGVSLYWLAIGNNLKSCNSDSLQLDKDIAYIDKKALSSGELTETGVWRVDSKFLPKEITKPILIEKINQAWLVDFGCKNISNGKWVLDIDSKKDIYDVFLLPGKRIQVTSPSSSFQCNIDEVVIVGQVKITLEYSS